MMSKAMGGAPKKRRKLKVRDAFAKLVDEEADKRVDSDDVTRVALADAEANGIVFLDEIDKIAVSDVRGGSVSREGVQRDLLPLIEGTTVATKYGPIKTDHILFIASGAFHVAKPSDLLPELQGRLPIRVELAALTEEDFVRILSATRASLTEQYCALLATEDVTITFADDGIAALARIAAEVNAALENIGARRLSTVMEKLLEDISFTAEDRGGETLVVDAAFVEKQLSGIARDTDLSQVRALKSSPALGGGGAAKLTEGASRGPARRLAPSVSLGLPPPRYERGGFASRYRHSSPCAKGGHSEVFDPRQPQPPRHPIVARRQRAGPADAVVEGVARAVAGVVDADRLAVAVEPELGADRGPQAAILLGRDAEGARGIGRVRRYIRRASRARRRSARPRPCAG